MIATVGNAVECRSAFTSSKVGQNWANWIIDWCQFSYQRVFTVMIDQWIEQLKKGNCISEPDLKKLCIHVRTPICRHKYPAIINGQQQCTFLQVKNLLMEESNVQFVRSPVTVCMRSSACLLATPRLTCLITILHTDMWRHPRSILWPFRTV